MLNPAKKVSTNELFYCCLKVIQSNCLKVGHVTGLLIQYLLCCPDDDADNLCTVVISLMQKGRRELRDEGLDMLTIGEPL